MTMSDSPALPVVDLFAGPGGLSEGFSAFEDGRRFRVAISIEKDRHARRTLALRAFFRGFQAGSAPEEYYQYLRGNIAESELASAWPKEWETAQREAWLEELGPELPRRTLLSRIDQALGADARSGRSVLIGGPPCQAYSLAGRARMLPMRGTEFDSDRRHVLYREYLKVLADYAPAAFVMENVKGLLSAQHQGSPIFPRIVNDLERPGRAIGGDSRRPHESYRLFPLVGGPQARLLDGPVLGSRDPRDFIVQAEKVGIPQARHRVIVVGLRSDLAEQLGGRISTLEPSEGEPASVDGALEGLPELRSGLSDRPDDPASWQRVLRRSASRLLRNTKAIDAPVLQRISQVREWFSSEQALELDRGRRYIEQQEMLPSLEREWFHDPRLRGVVNHQSRGHMEKDLQRYLFASVYAEVTARSPRLAEFPPSLLPRHKNVEAALRRGTFADRFRVQTSHRPASTITSHIAKDGHYYIHPDPLQCRSLTVREAARLQTFPDNYFFEGPRTEQYRQVGNAVPPLLAHRIAGLLSEALREAGL